MRHRGVSRVGADPRLGLAVRPTEPGSPVAHVAPLPLGTHLGRIDAGQDLDRPQHFNVVALGAGVCRRLDPPGGHAWGGLGAAYFTLDHPVTVNGRTYREWYTAECGLYMVRQGQRVHVGQAVAFTKSGWTETGFYAGQDMNSQVPTEAGRDFHAWLLAMWKGERSPAR